MNQPTRFAILFLLATPVALHAGLTATVPDDFATIQEAVDYVENDLAPGIVTIRSNAVFNENVRIQESVTVRAAAGFQPVIEWDRLGSTVRIDPHGESTTFVQIQDVTIRALSLNGNGAYQGISINNYAAEAALLVYLTNIQIDVEHSDEGVIAYGSGGDVYLQITDSTIDVEGDGSGSPACVRIDPSDRNLDTVLRGNTFRFTRASGIIIQGGADGTLTTTNIDRNRFQAYDTATSEGFWAIAIGGTGSAGYFASPTRTTVTNNLVVGARAGIDVNGQQQHTHTVFANNNTIIGSRYSAVELQSYADSEVVVRLANNVISGSSEFGLSASTYSTSPLDLVNDTNLFFDNAFGDIDGATAGPGTLFVDPGFVSPAAGDYRLATGSAAVDAGNGTPAGGTGVAGRDLSGGRRVLDGDFDGSARVDLGAYELDPEIFSDGFESGTFGAWSAVAGTV